MPEWLQALLGVIASMTPLIGSVLLFKQQQQSDLVKQLREDLDAANDRIKDLEDQLGITSKAHTSA